MTAHPSDSAMPPKQHPEIEITVRDAPMIGEVSVMGKYMDDAKKGLTGAIGLEQFEWPRACNAGKACKEK